jgi:hypothetical protein
MVEQSGTPLEHHFATNVEKHFAYRTLASTCAESLLDKKKSATFKNK